MCVDFLGMVGGIFCSYCEMAGFTIKSENPELSFPKNLNTEMCHQNQMGLVTLLIAMGFKTIFMKVKPTE